MYQSQMQEPASQAVGEDYRPQSAQSRMDAWFRSHSDLVALLAVAAGFLLRVRAAAGTFLNPDEALHFSVANQTSLPAAYRASLTLAHPPLLIFLLYFWRHVGTSEFVLRLPSVDRKSTRLNSSHMSISYAVFCLKKKKKKFYNANEESNKNYKKKHN